MNEILSRFALEGTPVSCERYGNGHINETYLVRTDAPHDYILQKVNRRVFPDTRSLMENIIAVTSWLRREIKDPRRVLTLVPAKDGSLYQVMPDGELYRVYEFVRDGLCLMRPESTDDLRQSGVAFGGFQNDLADFPADTLKEIIPHFHDTVERYRQLKTAIQEDRAGRAGSVQAEIDFYLAREKDADGLMSLLRQGVLPLRVTHNDTKLNNVILDMRTRTPLCVIDLDTVMPGLAANDFGDSIRFGANTSTDDQKDLDRVCFSLPMYEAYTEGFLSVCGSRLTEPEKETLPLGAKLMTLECGSRFLADFLNGDVYFRTSRPDQNLDRTRTQMKLVSEMEKHANEMQAIVQKTCRTAAQKNA